MININGEVWGIYLVSPHHPLLKMHHGGYALGVCDDPLKVIAINKNLTGQELKHVLCHEITHAAMYSYNVDLDYIQEEVLANLIAQHGQEIVSLTNKIL